MLTLSISSMEKHRDGESELNESHFMEQEKYQQSRSFRLSPCWTKSRAEQVISFLFPFASLIADVDDAAAVWKVRH